MRAKAIRLILADDHAVVRHGFRLLLEKEGIDVVGEASDGLEALELVEKLKPDQLVVDIGMPRLNGLEVVRRIVAGRSATRAIVLTLHTEDQYFLAAIRAGVRGYVVKADSADELVRATRAVHAGGVYISPSISRTLVDAYLSGRGVDADPLTPRERQVLQLVAEGNSTKEVAVLLGLSVKTAETHRSRIMTKLGIHGTANLVRYAISRGLIEP